MLCLYIKQLELRNPMAPLLWHYITRLQPDVFLRNDWLPLPTYPTLRYLPAPSSVHPIWVVQIITQKHEGRHLSTSIKTN